MDKPTKNRNRAIKGIRTKDSKDSSKSVKFSVRIGSFVTSISIKKNICSLWLLLKEHEQEDFKGIILDFIHLSLPKWNKDTAKGFSDFITERMIKDILTKKDFIEYKRIQDTI